MKALVLRGHKALGDLLYCSPIPRVLKLNGYERVEFACWNENQGILWNNPFIDEIKLYPQNMTQDQFSSLYTQYFLTEYDSVFDLRFSIEYRFLFRTDETVPDLETRREKNKNANYYEETIALTPYHDTLTKFRPEIYMTEEELKTVLEFKKQFPKFILWQLYGSSNAKLLTRAPLWINSIAEKVPDVYHFLIGSQPFEVRRLCGSEKVVNTSGKWSIRTVVCLASVANLTIGPESFLSNLSGAYNTPKIILYSATKHHNLSRDFDNVYYFYPSCDCHPCYLINISPKEIWDLKRREQAWQFELACRVRDPFHPYRYLGFRCTQTLPEKEIVETAVEILNKPSPPVHLKIFKQANEFEERDYEL